MMMPPCGLHPLDDDVVLVGDVVLEHAGAARGPDALGRVQVLDGHRQAVERADGVAAGQGRLGVAGLGHRLVAADGEEGVKVPVQLLDAAEEELRHLHGREVTAADALRQLPGGGEGQITVGHVSSLAAGSRWSARDERIIPAPQPRSRAAPHPLTLSDVEGSMVEPVRRRRSGAWVTGLLDAPLSSFENRYDSSVSGVACRSNGFDTGHQAICGASPHGTENVHAVGKVEQYGGAQVSPDPLRRQVIALTGSPYRRLRVGRPPSHLHHSIWRILEPS